MYWKGDKVDQEDFNYELGTSVDVFLNKTTKLSSSLPYISAKHSAYNLCGEDVAANLRFSKFLAEGLELYAELKDIVDKEVYEETWDAAPQNSQYKAYAKSGAPRLPLRVLKENP